MKRKSFFKTFLSALGYSVMGNVLALVLAFTLIPFRRIGFLAAIFALCAAFVYLSLVFTAAYKDGTSYRNSKSAEKPPKRRWLLISLALWGISVIWAAVLLLLSNDSLGLPYLALNGAVAPLSVWVKTAYMPYVGIGFYALNVPACLVGFWCGLNNKLDADRIVYKK